MASTWRSWGTSATTYYVDESGSSWSSWNSTTSASTTNDTWYTWTTGSTATSNATNTTDTYVWEDWCEDDGYVIIERTDDGFFRTWSNDLEEKLYSQMFDRIKAHYAENQRTINRIWGELLAEELRQEKEAAENKAKELLLDLVSEKEFELYKRTGKLLVKGRKHSYIISKAGKIVMVKNKDERVIQGMCIHLNNTDKYKCPETDNVIALKLNIENDEEKFLKTANHHSDRPPYGEEMEFLKVVNE